jgi:hypothetical protein
VKKIIISESQLKKLVKKTVIKENLDMEDDGMRIPVKMAIFSHLSDIQEMSSDQQVIERVNFLKRLIKKYPNIEQEVSTTDLDGIYDEMLGMTKRDKMNPRIDDNPFKDGFDLSLNENKKIKK